MPNEFWKKSPTSVLIVDDNPGNLLAVESIVRPLADRVDIARNGREAIALCAAESYSLILMDVMMPEMDGIEAATRIRALPDCSETPVIFLTAADVPHIISRGYALGLTDFIFKPISADILRGKLSLFLELYRRSQRLRGIERERKEAITSAQFRSFVENVADYAIFMMDTSGKIVTWNQGGARILGYSEAGILGKHFSCLFTPEDRARGAPEDEIRSAYDDGKTQSEQWLLREDGSRFWASGLLVGVHDEQNKLFGFAKILRDVTDKKVSEERLRLRARELARTNAELQRFTFIASHDLKEPLRQVASYVQLLGKKYRNRLDSEADEYIDFAVTGVKRIYGLIGDLLEYSRVGRIEEPFTEVNARGALEVAVSTIESAHPEAKLAVHAGNLPTVTGMQSALVQLFQQLIGNSLKFRRGENASVTVEAERVGEHWLFTVCDDGIGIDAQYAEKIFEVFRRLHSKEQYPGSGIGLAICKKIVERHGGRIWIDAASKNGAQFHFTLAVNPPSMMDLRPEAMSPPPPEETSVQSDRLPGLSPPSASQQ